MTNDYDIVIIGGSLAGREAALAATQLRAKVALVEPKVNYGFVYHHALTLVSQLSQQLGDVVGVGIHPHRFDSPEKSHISVTWAEAMLYAKGVVANLTEQYSPALLVALGVDVIIGNGQFQSSPRLAFAVNDRLLRARTYLLASGSRPAVPEIEGLQATGYLTLANIWHFLQYGRGKPSNSPAPKPPKEWVIIGGVPQSIEIAQILARFGCSVTLVIKHPYLLPHLDPEIAQLLQAQLELDGVRIITQATVTQVMRIEDKKWVQAGDKAIETDEILVAIGQEPNFDALNLAGVGVKWHRYRLVVNEKLQTTNRQIYACGDVIGGYDFANVANYEAKIAINNALFFPRNQVNYRCIPWAIFTQPMLAQIGLTEAQAKRRYRNNELLVLRQYFKTLAIAQISGQTTGICKLIVLENGEILGAEILGAAAGELINIIALAISQNIKVKYLTNLAPVYPSFSEILERIAQDWCQQRLNSKLVWQEFLDSFYQFRRDGNL